jgi:hypothetical protein
MLIEMEELCFFTTFIVEKKGVKIFIKEGGA